jgi:hypothetical protein
MENGKTYGDCNHYSVLSGCVLDGISADIIQEACEDFQEIED